MGTLIRSWTKIPLPQDATVKNGTATWTAKGKKRTGKLSGSNQVSVQVDTWTAQFTDETGKVRRVSTKTKNRSAAEKILARLEADVDRIKSGVVTREELTKAPVRPVVLIEALEKFRTKMVAGGNTAKHIKRTIDHVCLVLQESGIDTIAQIRREAIERWIADEVQKKKRAPRTINSYIVSLKSFVLYLTNIDLLPKNPLKAIRKLNEAVDQRKQRRAMTAEEVERLLIATTNGVAKYAGQPEERMLIYRLLLGTGLRSTELSLLTPSQIDFERCRLTIEAVKTKNKKADVLPLRPELVQSVKEWIETHEIQPHERIFHFSDSSILRSFYGDLKAAGIERKSPDGRSIDIHSLRKTFGTRLAAAGVPLTTVQRLMRHSTPTLTAKLYIDVDPINMMEALEKLPAN
jgi:integrase